MGLTSFAFGLKGVHLRLNSAINFGFYLFLGVVFGLLAIFATNFPVRNWCFRFGVFYIGDSVSCWVFVILSQLILGLLVWRLGWKCIRFERILAQIWGKLTEKRNGFCSTGQSCRVCGSKIQFVKHNGHKNCETDLENVVMSLRKKLGRERKRRKEALLELEREREASASASEEALAKIMFLQSEKALVEREARQYRELMEKKEMYDQEIIEHLQFVIESFERGESSSALRFVQIGDDEIHQDEYGSDGFLFS
ncbi:hypothetical protein LUZ60_017703 [Juncus effusus]|nr:hypothetical protein LUZ60_017703 [Juncus effusus]